MHSVTIRIDGMSCGHCVAGVTRALGRLDGVRVERVEVGSARVAYDPDRMTPDRIAGAIAEAGFQPQVEDLT